jgi:hypothetical protein
LAKCDVVRGASDGSAAHNTYHGAIIRVQAWLRALTKLNHPGDFQPAAAASRALFELAVDLTLLHTKQPAFDFRKMLAWEESAKLGSAERAQRHFTARGVDVPPEYEPLIVFIQQQRDRILELRRQTWGNTRHPSRWTGQSLETDARTAGAEFADYYALRYAQICWNTHGSGLVAVRMISEENFPAFTGLAFDDAARFGAIAAQQALQLFGRFDAAAAEAFEQLREDIGDHAARILEGHRVSGA